MTRMTGFFMTEDPTCQEHVTSSVIMNRPGGDQPPAALARLH